MLFQRWFRLNQRCFRFCLKWFWTAVTFRRFSLNIFNSFENILKYLNSSTEFWFSAHIAERKWTIKKYLFCFITGQRYNINSNFWVLWCYWSEKLIWLKFPKAFARFVKWTSNIVAENSSFCCNSETWANLHYAKPWRVILRDFHAFSCVSIIFWLRHHNLIF